MTLTWNRKQIAFLGAVVWALGLLLVPAGASARSRLALPCGPLANWCGDFNAGFSKWDGLDGNAASDGARRRYFALPAANSSVPIGGRYFRALVDRNAVTEGEAGQRSLAYLFPSNYPELNRSGAYEGSDQWYHFSVLFPARFRPSPDTSWNWFAEWHNWPNAVCCANVALTVDTRDFGGPTREAVSMRVMGGGDPEYPAESRRGQAARNPSVRTAWLVGDRRLKRAHWYDVAVHIIWSHRHDTGMVEWWLDRRPAGRRRQATLFFYADDNDNVEGESPGPGQAYFMQGYYRPDRIGNRQDRSIAAVHHIGARRGPTWLSVAY